MEFTCVKHVYLKTSDLLYYESLKVELSYFEHMRPTMYILLLQRLTVREGLDLELSFQSSLSMLPLFGLMLDFSGCYE